MLFTVWAVCVCAIGKRYGCVLDPKFVILFLLSSGDSHAWVKPDQLVCQMSRSIIIELNCVPIRQSFCNRYPFTQSPAPSTEFRTLFVVDLLPNRYCNFLFNF